MTGYRERPYVPARDPLSAIPPSRHPFQVWLMFALVISGASNLFTPGAVTSQVDPFFHKIWACTLLVGGLATLVGTFWRDRVTGLLLERLGLGTVGMSSSVFSILAVEQLGLAQGVVGWTLTASVGAAAFWRVVHVNRELAALGHFVAQNYT